MKTERSEGRDDLSGIIRPADFKRMKILARAMGFELPNKKAVWRILYLADVFRGILRLSKIQREKEVAEITPEQKRPRD